MKDAGSATIAQRTGIARRNTGSRSNSFPPCFAARRLGAVLGLGTSLFALGLAMQVGLVHGHHLRMA